MDYGYGLFIILVGILVSVPVVLVLGTISTIIACVMGRIFRRFFTEVVEEGEDGEEIRYWVI